MTDRKNEGTPQCHGFVRDMFVSPSSNEVSSITIVKKLHDIQFEILEIHKILKRVEVFMNAIVKRVEDSNLACSTNQLKYANMFPCTTRNELENINAEIRNEASNFNEVSGWAHRLLTRRDQVRFPDPAMQIQTPSWKKSTRKKERRRKKGRAGGTNSVLDDVLQQVSGQTSAIKKEQEVRN
ncbi:hypothetical protein HUJ05_001631 [Dendroctonus ponderosae]|nr:hypothetical protein HUJ05_001631 [Dendroctonus ponderosae]